MFNLKILTPQKTVYDGKASYLEILTPDGIQVILENHAPFLSRIDACELKYMDEKEIHPYVISSGFVEVLGNEVNIMVDDAVHSKDIDEGKAQEAIKRAEEIIKTIDNESDINRLKNKIKIANLHISTKKKYRNRNMKVESPVDN